MKKQELLDELHSREVRSSNLKTAMRIANIKKSVEKHGFEKVKEWLLDIEERESKALAKALDKQKSSGFNMSVREYRKLHGKAKRILSNFSTGHSMGCHKTLTINGRTFATADTTEEYSRGYRAVHGSFSIDLTKKALRDIENIEGIWTIRKKDGKASWLQSCGSKHTYRVEWEHGFLVGESHSSISLEHAQEIQKRKEKLETKLIQDNMKFIGYQHIRALGACMPGIRAFCDRHNLNPDMGYNLGFLKSLQDPYANRYLNAV